jgi:hypothetical protein
VTLTRRDVLALLSVAVAGAGCTGPADPTVTEATTNTDPSEPSPTTDSSATTDPTDAGPRDLLPAAGDGWTLLNTEFAGYRRLGYDEGVLAVYEAPDGTRVSVLVVTLRAGDPSAQAEEFADTGWQVALAYRRFALAAGTGTDQRTFTPEKPITLDRTPIPETEPLVRELVAWSPALSAEYVAEHDVTG